MNTCEVSKARTRNTVTPSAASSTNSTAAVDPVSRALDSTPASDDPAALEVRRPGAGLPPSGVAIVSALHHCRP